VRLLLPTLAAALLALPALSARPCAAQAPPPTVTIELDAGEVAGPEVAVRSLVARSEAGEHAEAMAVAQLLVEWLDASPAEAESGGEREPRPTDAWPAQSELSEELRAGALHAAGVATLRAGEGLEAPVGAVAELLLRRASAAAGPGALRRDALYDAGVARLQEGERHRRAVPEIIESEGLVPPQPPPAEEAEEGEEPPDPLDLALEAYHAARAALVERLRVDAADADTRANLELCHRRIVELEELRERRERERQEQQDDGDDQQSEESDQGDEEQQQDGEQPPDEQEQEEQEEQDQQESDPSGGEQDEEQQQDEQQPPPEPEEQEQEQPEPSEAEEPSEPSEVHLSREEAQRILDRLQELEEQARAIEAQARKREREKVDRDW
jgi:hypothetical protein